MFKEQARMEAEEEGTGSAAEAKVKA